MSDKRGMIVAWLGAALMTAIGSLTLFVATVIVAHADTDQAGTVSIGGNPAFSEMGIAKAGNMRVTWPFGGFTRTYWVHIPKEKKSDGDKLAVVIMLHGAGGDGANAIRQTAWDKKADKESFIAVFPEALPTDPSKPASFRQNPRVWEDGSGRGGTGRGKVDDIGFIGAILDRVAQQYPIDANRIYVTGFSNGGSMAFRIVASPLASRIAAAAPVAGRFFASDAIPPRPVPTLLIFGTKDPLNPLQGGKARSLWGKESSMKPKVDDSVVAWAKLGGCTGKPALISDEGGIRRLAYGPGKDGVEFLYWTVDGLGHHWPGNTTEGLPKSLVGEPSKKLEGTDAIWTFLSRHTLVLRAEKP